MVATAAPQCKLGGAADQGKSTWSIVESGTSPLRVVKGFARTTENGVTTQSAILITVDPDTPNQIVPSGRALHGTLTR